MFQGMRVVKATSKRRCWAGDEIAEEDAEEEVSDDVERDVGRDVEDEVSVDVERQRRPRQRRGGGERA